MRGEVKAGKKSATRGVVGKKGFMPAKGKWVKAAGGGDMPEHKEGENWETISV